MKLGQVDEDLELFLGVLPEKVRTELIKHGTDNLVEVAIDLDRVPEARYTDGTMLELGDEPIQLCCLQQLASKFIYGDDNRAGINSTLHRISCIRDRYSNIVGLTCRLGRAVYGSAEIIRDLLETGKSILVLGPPGCGKSTLLRDSSRILSTELNKRVIIVDTSNEIAGDGSSPHRAVGRSRRMQVTTPSKQHLVMIEAVENHTPQVIIIDEISGQYDVSAARTIAERGVQLIATAHGLSIENIISNPQLADVLGGIQTVTLSDDEAKRRGCQKTVLERKYAPTFDIVVEIKEIGTVAVHHDSTLVVDKLLKGVPSNSEVRTNKGGKVKIEESTKLENIVEAEVKNYKNDRCNGILSIYTYGIGRRKVEQSLEDLHIGYKFVNEQTTADLVITLRKNEGRITSARTKAILLRSNTKTQIHDALNKYFAR